MKELHLRKYRLSEMFNFANSKRSYKLMRLGRGEALFLILLTLCSFGSFAQNDKRSYFSITGGYSLPVGELAREKMNDPLAGVSGSGHFLQANYDFRITRGLGLKLSGSLNRNKTKPGPILEKADEYVTSIKPLINETTNHTWQTSVSKWKFNAVMLGPALYLNFNKVQFEAHVQAGYIELTSPSVDVIGTFESGNNRIVTKLSPVSKNLWGGAAGASWRIPLGNTLYFHLSGDFIATEAKMKDVTLNVQIGDYPVFPMTLNEKRFVGVANAGAGFGIMF